MTHGPRCSQKDSQGEEFHPSAKGKIAFIGSQVGQRVRLKEEVSKILTPLQFTSAHLEEESSRREAASAVCYRKGEVSEEDKSEEKSLMRKRYDGSDEEEQILFRRKRKLEVIASQLRAKERKRVNPWQQKN